MPRFDARLRKLEAALAGRCSQQSYQTIEKTYREFEQRSKEYVERASLSLPDGWRFTTDSFIGARGGICGSLLRATDDAEGSPPWYIRFPERELVGIGDSQADPSEEYRARFAVARRPIFCLQRAWFSDEGLEV